MRSFAILAGFFAVSAIAGPLVKRADDPCDDDAPPCMTITQATKVANNFKDLINLPFSTELATAALTVDFNDYSDSVSELINSGCTGPQPLGVATFTSRDAFIKGQSGQPPIPFEILNLWHTCDTVIIRWRTALTPEFVTGIIVLETEYQNNATEPFLIDTVYSEFNSGAWLVDLGVFTPSCNSTTSAKRSLSDPAPLRIM